jgi:putative hydrolase of the HAD superfamily
MALITTVGFDADDTLWQNLSFYRLTEERFAYLLADHADPEQLGERLLAAERKNLKYYGFGIKGFTLSMVETALDVTNQRLPGNIIAQILDIGREMLEHPVELLPGVVDTLEKLRGRRRLILITKGDLFDQERKIAGSGLAEFFDAVEIVSDKNTTTYERIFAQYGDGPRQSLMIGNSLKSDVVPALAAGAWGIFVPHEIAWALEHDDEPDHNPRYRRLSQLGDIVTLLDEIDTKY